MDNNQNQQSNGYGMPQPNMQAGMPGQTPQPGYGMPGQGMQAGYGTPGQTPQPGYGMPGPGVQPGMQPGYGMPGQSMQPGYGMSQQPAGGNQPPKKKKTGLIVGLIILAVVLIVLIGGGIFAFMKLGKKDGSKGSSKDAEAAKQTVVDFCEGMKNRDMDAIVDAYHPDLQSSVADNFYTSNGVSSEDEFWDHYDTVFGGYSFAYTASDATKVSDSKRESTLDIINAAYSLSLDADTMYEVDTEETYSGSNGKMVLAEQIYLIEDDGKWYVIYAESTQKENTLVAADTEDTEEDTEEVTEEETTEATTESAASTTPVNSDGFDWENMQFTMLGKPYNLATLTYDDILAMGYSIDDEYLEEELEDNQYSMSARAEAADESDMYIRFKNFTGGGTKKVSECEILGIELSRDDFDNKYDAALGNGITFGMTPDEVKAVMGEPTSDYTSDTSDYMTLTYEENDEAYASSVEFTFQDGVLTKIDLENYN